MYTIHSDQSDYSQRRVTQPPPCFHLWFELCGLHAYIHTYNRLPLYAAQRNAVEQKEGLEYLGVFCFLVGGKYPKLGLGGTWRKTASVTPSFMDAFLLKRPGAGAPARQAKAPRPAAAAAPSYLVACPVCNRQVPHSVINSHLDGSECRAAAEARSVEVAPAQAGAGSSFDSAPVAERPASKKDSDADGGVFDTMMDSARQASRVIHCSLWRDTDGCRRDHATETPPCGFALDWSSREPSVDGWLAGLSSHWSGEACLKVRRGDNTVDLVARLRLHAGADAASARHPRLLGSAGGGWGLSLSQLKSALQKNIRLCRPAAAVRVAWELASRVDEAGRRVGETELLRAPAWTSSPRHT